MGDRLISANKLKNHYAWWDDEKKEIFDTIVDLQPTAYNINKVVKQLEEMKAKPMELKYDVPLIESIIEIVKKGGAV